MTKAKKIKTAKKNTEKGTQTSIVTPRKHHDDRNTPVICRDGVDLYMNHPRAHDANLRFEQLNASVVHVRCPCCRIVSTKLKLINKRGVCKRCSDKKARNATYIPPWLPTWQDEDKKTHYTVPQCLKVLREGEKLLIQRVSTYVPLRFMKGGSHASKGHVCCFPKQLQDFVTELPRKKVEAVKVIRRFVGPDKEIDERTFAIRKTVVLDALRWLKRYHRHYKDIIIQEANLSWMNGETEAELDVVVVQKQSPCDRKREQEATVNLRVRPEPDDNEYPAYGVVRFDSDNLLPKARDQATVAMVRDMEQRALDATSRLNIDNNERNSPVPNAMEFPEVGTEAISEYDDDYRIFCCAFPWLFPGGVGDWGDIPETEDMTVEEWAKYLLMYEDGRFARDKIWCFYALNYVQRKKNMEQGSFFVRTFAGSGSPKTIEDLHKLIDDGDTSWIEKISYFGNIVRGSAPFWRQRREEIQSWILYHVLNGNGAPTVFVTLSCAEHYWPDVKRLLRERKGYEKAHDGLATGIAKDDEDEDVSVHEYTIVIQEYFQMRVKHWFDTVGKDVFNVKHYWLRFEFAPGRGQIHAHCLLITDNLGVQQRAYDAMKTVLENDIQDDMELARAKVYQEWTENDLCMTASLPNDFERPVSLQGKHHPASRVLSEVKDMKQDAVDLMLTVQNHVCTDYCMRKRTVFRKDETKKSRQRRVCRNGCGVEKTAGACDTPGFPKNHHACISTAAHTGYKRFELPRRIAKERINTNPTSMALIHGWRANCDVKILLFESDPKNPDSEDITKVTNYIVSYASKGVETLQHERQQLRMLILATDEKTGCERDVVALARRILNRYVGERVVSKQECMVQLLGLDLWVCSESFHRISLSGYTKIDSRGTTGMNRTLRDYAYRKNHLGMSLMTWFLAVRSKKGNRTIIPHFPGRGVSSVYPITDHMAKMLLLIYKPWDITRHHGDSGHPHMLRSFLQSADCPESLKYTFKRDRYRATIRQQEPTDKPDNETQDVREPVDEAMREAIDAFSVLPSNHAVSLVHEYPFEFGFEYDWSIPNSGFEIDIQVGATWLMQRIEEAENVTTNGIRLPTNPRNGNKPYEFEELKGQQRDIALEVMQKIKEWTEVDLQSDLTDFCPLHLTIRGQAGSGKTTLIHTIVTMVVSLFSTNESGVVVCPSGCAAFNAGGKTLHGRFHVSVHSVNNKLEPPQRAWNRMIKENGRIVVLIMDERSMTPADVLGFVVSYLVYTAHNGKNQNARGGWGGIPVVLFFGDDGQLPPIGIGSFDFKTSSRENWNGGHYLGMQTFLEMATDVRTLNVNYRQNTNQDTYRQILDEAYTGIVTDTGAERLMELHLDNPRFTDEDRTTIRDRSIHVFANKEPMDKHNNRQLFLATSALNPVACIAASDEARNKRHLSECGLVKSLTIARNSRVCLQGRNLRPEWGLYNNASGTVIDLVFKEGESPNSKSLPVYVLVDFPSYTGKAFIDSQPTYVPLVPVTVHCQKGCCARTQLPLRLAYGQTIHTFQGLTVGTDDNHTTYKTPSIVIYPGSLSFEGKNPGLFYSACSRGTTIGTAEDPLSSSIYFQGQSMSKERVADMTRTKKGEVFKRIIKRKQWTELLDSHNRRVIFSEKEETEIIEWMRTTKHTPSSLDAIISKYNVANTKLLTRTDESTNY